MSKMDELRALREARYERGIARAGASSRGAPTSEKPPAAKPEVTSPTAATEAKLCGHRSISGRTCTREHGHAAKSHRYS